MNEPSLSHERFVPGTRGEIWIEHWHRYHFARRWAAGKGVLDVACGEGYGSALLASAAQHVVGVDVAAEAIERARATYAGIANLEFRAAPCTALPLAEAAVDLAVSFETIEHIAEQEGFLDELARVLRPAGVLLLSSPNKLEYSDKRAYTNAFHVKELYREELARLVRARFPHVAWYGQRPTFFSVIAPEAGAYAGELVEIEEGDPRSASPKLAHPLYFLLVASRRAESVASLPAALSVMSDRGDWVHRDYEKVMRELEHTVARGEALEGQVAEREKSIAALQEEVRALRRPNAAQGGGEAPESGWRGWLRAWLKAR